MTLTEDNIADYADTLVLQARGRGVTLDYSEASVEQMDALFALSDELLRGENFPEAQRNLVIFYGGCYLGETLARCFGGVWKFEPNWYDSTLVFTVPEGGLQLRPFHKVHQRVADDETGNRLADYRDGLKLRLAGI